MTAQQEEAVPGATRRLAALLALAAPVVAVAASLEATVVHPGNLVTLLLSVAVVTVAVWYALTRRGVLRLIAVPVAVLAATSIILIGLSLFLVQLALLVVFAVAGRHALGRDPATMLGTARAVGPARHGVLLINPKSGNATAVRLNLAVAAAERGIRVITLAPGDDLAALTEQAAADGADVLGMAGGDGSQAIVAATAARHDLAFVCVPSGTRNHFALDLGLDRGDVVGALDAFTAGVERTVDLGQVNGRVFVNNASLGVYAEVVQSRAYRGAKLRTWSRLLPDLLGPAAAPPDLVFDGPDGRPRTGMAMVLVSNNPYRLSRLGRAGGRPRMDAGRLGILAARVRGAAGSRRTAGPRRFADVLEWSRTGFELRSAAPVPVGPVEEPEAAVMTVEPTVRGSGPSRRDRIVRARPGLAGSVLAVLFSCASLTPSLLPRAWYLQGVMSGLTAVIGYGAGATLGAVVRRVWRRRHPRATRIAWWARPAVAVPAGLTMLALGTKWQQELRARLDMEPMASYDIIRIVGVGVLTFVVLLVLARLLRLGTRRLARLLRRWVPRPVAYGAGLLVTLYLTIGFVDGFLVDNALAVADRTASLTNGGTSAGVVLPGSALRSGSPASAAPWRTLGRQGRDFVGTGPTESRLAAFTGRPVREPIRLYAGLDSAVSAEARARLVVSEMDRTGAFHRQVVAIITPTGTGWVDRDVTDSLEYMYGGDTALVSMQYSYLPSWISFLVDRSKVAESATALIAAVHARWSALLTVSRPRLLLFGESLGSFGTETAFDTAGALTAGADGTLLVGPPFANPIRRGLLPARDPGSPVWDPVYAGGTVEFTRDPADLRTRTGARPTVVYLQNSSDPIVWWSPELMFDRPEWLSGRRGPDVSPDMHWYPLVTFWQTALDQVFAIDVPAGHGHVYGSGVVDGWAALAAPPGWTGFDTVRLRALLDRDR
jgi:uncharacterized membrane protein